jgi:two-component system sensor histidine kinase KdpD
MADARPLKDDPLAGLSADELLRVLGHEMGNLVTIVSGYGQMLRDHWPFLGEDRRLDIVGRMNRQVDQLRVLIDNFQHLRWLTVSPDAASDAPLRSDLTELVLGMGDDLLPLAADHPLDLNVERGLPPVRLERSAVQHILMNLVVNATKFSPPEAPVRIDVSGGADEVCFSVTDRGPGIPADKRTTVFDKFVRLQEGGVGIGLGLFICRALAESMGGRVWVDDGDEGGARVSFALPVAHEH